MNLENNPHSELLIYPNPTENQITISGDKSELEELVIFNVLGQNVISSINIISISETKLLIDLSNIKSGMYTVKTKSMKNKVF